MFNLIKMGYSIRVTSLVSQKCLQVCFIHSGDSETRF